MLDQKGCRYTPHVFGVRVGQPLEIVNSDPTLHNIHAMPKANQEFNNGQPMQGMKNTHTFTTPEVMVPLQVRRARLDERLRRRARSSVLRRHGRRRRVRAEGPAAGHLHRSRRGTRSSGRRRRASRSARRNRRTSPSRSRPSGSRDLLLHRFAKLVAASTVLLIAAGGLVTSTGSGLVGARLAEHLRLVHVLVPAREDGRRHLLRARPPADRQHGRLPDDHPRGRGCGGSSRGAGCAGSASSRSARSSFRACSAASRSCCSCRRRSRSATPASRRSSSASRVSLALFTSPGWHDARRRRSTIRCCAGSQLATTVVIYCQILLGATMRHTRRGWRFRTSRWRSAISCRRLERRRSPFTSRTASARCSSRARSSRPRATSGIIIAPRRELVRPATLLVLLVADAGHARRARRLVGPPADHQHRARRQRRAGAGDVAGADAAQLPVPVRDRRGPSAGGSRATRAAHGCGGQLCRSLARLGAMRLSA